MNLSKREKKLLIVIGIMLIVVGIYYFVYEPAMSDVDDLYAQIDSEQQQIQELIALAEVNDALSREAVLIENEIVDALEALPEVSDESELVRHLHRLFLRYGWLNSVHIEDPVSRGEFSGVSVRLAYSLYYEEMRAVLLALETSPFKNRIDSFSLNIGHVDVVNETQEPEADIGQAGVVNETQEPEADAGQADVVNETQEPEADAGQAGVVNETQEPEADAGQADVVNDVQRTEVDMAVTFYFSN